MLGQNIWLDFFETETLTYGKAYSSLIEIFGQHHHLYKGCAYRC